MSREIFLIDDSLFNQWTLVDWIVATSVNFQESLG